MASPKTGFSSAHLKWIVIGVVGIVFMFIFKDDLSNMLKDADELKIGTAGIKITRTTQTPLGNVIVSGPPTPETAGITPESLPNHQSASGYLINWPQDGSWSSHPSFAQTIGADLTIAYNNSWGDYVPNVNVTIELSNTTSIRQWMESSNAQLASIGFTTTHVAIDNAERSGVRVVRGGFFGLEADAIQRIILNQGRAYIVTATRPVTLNTDPKLWQDLSEILNSFRVYS